jgi:hypothetical protein
LLTDIKESQLELKFSVGLQMADLKGEAFIDIYPEIKKSCY